MFFSNSQIKISSLYTFIILFNIPISGKTLTCFCFLFFLLFLYQLSIQLVVNIDIFSIYRYLLSLELLSYMIFIMDKSGMRVLK